MKTSRELIRVNYIEENKNRIGICLMINPYKIFHLPIDALPFYPELGFKFYATVNVDAITNKNEELNLKDIDLQ